MNDKMVLLFFLVDNLTGQAGGGWVRCGREPEQYDYREVLRRGRPRDKGVREDPAGVSLLLVWYRMRAWSRRCFNSESWCRYCRPLL